eukprot:g6351.t1
MRPVRDSIPVGTLRRVRELLPAVWRTRGPIDFAARGVQLVPASRALLFMPRIGFGPRSARLAEIGHRAGAGANFTATGGALFSSLGSVSGRATRLTEIGRRAVAQAQNVGGRGPISYAAAGCDPALLDRRGAERATPGAAKAAQGKHPRQ